MTLSQAPEAPSTPSDELKARLVLQHVAIMHRHGDRSPVFDQCGANLFVGEKEKEFWRQQLATSEQVEELAKVGKVVGPTPDQQPAGPPKHGGVFPGGNVTQRGLARLERVGEELRERYADFIDPSWGNHQVFVESTGFFRTIQSTQAFLKGMFPPRDGREPFFIRTNEFDTLSPSHPMDVYDSLEVKLERDMNDKYGPGGFEKLRERAYAALGADRSRPVPWSAARDILDCNRAHDVPVPDALPADVVKEICAVDCYMWHQLYGNLDFCRDYFRKGVREVFDILDQAAKQTNKHKLAVLSAHDSSIVSLLKALRVDLPSDSVPWYGSHLCMETYIDPVTRAAYLKFTLNGSPLVIGSSSSWASEFGVKASAGTVTSPSSGAGDDHLTPFTEVESIVREFFSGTDA